MDELLRQVLAELRGAWRYRWAAVIAAWAVALVGWVVVFALPSQYEATARVYVDTESAIRDFLKGLAAETNVATRVDYVRQKLLSRPYLEQVARETDLDLRAKDPKELEELKDRIHFMLGSGDAEHIVSALLSECLERPLRQQKAILSVATSLARYRLPLTTLM